MSEIHNLKIASATIKIRVIRVDNHKMTKATFNQLVGIRPYDDGNKIIKDDVLGWVNSGGIYLICKKDEKIGKYRLSEFGNNEDHVVWVKDYFEQLFIAT